LKSPDQAAQPLVPGDGAHRYHHAQPSQEQDELVQARQRTARGKGVS
jgi:hypothetical protein